METFYIVVLTIAAAILILILTSVGTMMRASAANTSWPPTSGRCPDSWSEDVKVPGKCFAPTDGKNLGTLAAMGTLLGTSATWTSSTLTFTTNAALAIGDKISIGGQHYKLTAAGVQCTATGTIAPKDIRGNTVDTTLTTISFELVGTVATYASNQLSFISPVALNAGDIIKADDQLYTIEIYTSNNKVAKTTSANTNEPEIQTDNNGTNPSITFTVIGKDFSATTETICTKKTWANTNQVIWDGVSTYNKCSKNV